MILHRFRPFNHCMRFLFLTLLGLTSVAASFTASAGPSPIPTPAVAVKCSTSQSNTTTCIPDSALTPVGASVQIQTNSTDILAPINNIQIKNLFQNPIELKSSDNSFSGIYFLNVNNIGVPKPLAVDVSSKYKAESIDSPVPTLLTRAANSGSVFVVADTLSSVSLNVRGYTGNSGDNLSVVCGKKALEGKDLVSPYADASSLTSGVAICVLGKENGFFNNPTCDANLIIANNNVAQAVSKNGNVCKKITHVPNTPYVEDVFDVIYENAPTKFCSSKGYYLSGRDGDNAPKLSQSSTTGTLTQFFGDTNSEAPVRLRFLQRCDKAAIYRQCTVSGTLNIHLPAVSFYSADICNAVTQSGNLIPQSIISTRSLGNFYVGQSLTLKPKIDFNDYNKSIPALSNGVVTYGSPIKSCSFYPSDTASVWTQIGLFLNSDCSVSTKNPETGVDNHLNSYSRPVPDLQVVATNAEGFQSLPSSPVTFGIVDPIVSGYSQNNPPTEVVGYCNDYAQVGSSSAPISQSSLYRSKDFYQVVAPPNTTDTCSSYLSTTPSLNFPTTIANVLNIIDDPTNNPLCSSNLPNSPASCAVGYLPNKINYYESGNQTKYNNNYYGLPSLSFNNAVFNKLAGETISISTTSLYIGDDSDKNCIAVADADSKFRDDSKIDQLPFGLTVRYKARDGNTPAQCVISGVLPTGKNYEMRSFSIAAVDRNGQSLPAQFQLSVSPTNTIGTLAYNSSQIHAVVGQFIRINPIKFTNDTTVPITGCALDNVFVKSNNAQFPQGLNVDPKTCQIYGTPTSVSELKDFSVVATNGIGKTNSARIAIGVYSTPDRPLVDTSTTTCPSGQVFNGIECVSNITPCLNSASGEVFVGYTQLHPIPSYQNTNSIVNEYEELSCSLGNCPGATVNQSVLPYVEKTLAMQAGESGSFGGKATVIAYDILGQISSQFSNGSNGNNGSVDIELPSIKKYCANITDSRGTNGFLWMSGSSDPNNSSPNIAAGTKYLNTTTNNYFQYSSSNWVPMGNIYETQEVSISPSPGLNNSTTGSVIGINPAIGADPFTPIVNFTTINYSPINYTLPATSPNTIFPNRIETEAIFIFKKVDSSVRDLIQKKYINPRFQ